jgi:hypothetical protein
MASTNEDAVVLATSHEGDAERLVIRHLPDRGTVEIGWWNREPASGAITPGAAPLELAAEAAEIHAFARLCRDIPATAWTGGAEGDELARTPPDAEGIHLAARRAATGLALTRHPEGGTLPLPSAEALALLNATLPPALEKLETLGFGLIQQADDTGH